MRTFSLPVLVAILVGLSARDARANESACTGVTVEADAAIETPSPELLERVRGMFEAREDVDRCAHVILTSVDRMIDVEVVLPDGRSARRVVARKEDVLPALEALLIVPPRPQAAPDLSEPSADTPSTPPAPSAPHAANVTSPETTPVPTREAIAPVPAQRSSHLKIELSALAGARIGDGQESVGLGAVSFLELSGWLLGFAGRVDRYRRVGGQASGGALELTALLGHRFGLEGRSLDLDVGLAAALQGTQSFEAQAVSMQAMPTPAGSMQSCTAVAGGGCVTKASSTSTVPRLVLGARLNFGALSTVRTFVGLDGELGPGRAGDSVGLPDASRLPIWTLGLALGATVGTQ